MEIITNDTGIVIPDIINGITSHYSESRIDFDYCQIFKDILTADEISHLISYYESNFYDIKDLKYRDELYSFYHDYLKAHRYMKYLSINEGEEYLLFINNYYIGTLTRVVIGDHGPYFEIDTKTLTSDIHIPTRELWRFTKRFDNCKYYHLNHNKINIKIYLQTKQVSYADYIPGYCYISCYYANIYQVKIKQLHKENSNECK
jgi:hypothetical protein